MFKNFTKLYKQYFNSNNNNNINSLVESLEKLLILEEFEDHLKHKIIKDYFEELEKNSSQLNNKEFLWNTLYNIFNKYILGNVEPVFKDKICFYGPSGSGKTTMIGKFGNYLHNKNKISLNYSISLDFFRPGAQQQLDENSKLGNLGNISYGESFEQRLGYSLGINGDYKIYDTHGINELNDNNNKYINSLNLLDSTNVYVINCLVGREIFNLCNSIKNILNIDYIIITNCDDEARAGICLSASYIFNCPIIFLSNGERIREDKLIKFNKEKIINQIMGKEDIKGVVELMGNAVDDNILNSIMAGEINYLTISKLLNQVSSNKMNDILSLMGNLPSLGIDDINQHKQIVTLVNSMTLLEKLNKVLITKDRIDLIAYGSGIGINNTQLLMGKMDNIINILKDKIKQFGSMGKSGGPMPSMKSMMDMMKGVDPSSLNNMFKNMNISSLFNKKN